METTAYIALSRQMALRQRMDVIANNVANMTTTGFKAQTLLLEPAPRDAGASRPLAFVHDIGALRETDPGPMTPTGNPLDLALEGPGYFVVDTPDGMRYTRAGQFQLNPFNELVTAAGDPVLDDGGAPIDLPGDATSVTRRTARSRAPTTVRSVGSAWSRSTTSRRCAGSAAASTRPISRPPRPTARASCRACSKASNVQPVLEMTEMMATVRAYESTQSLVDSHHELQRRAIERMLEANG